MPPPSNTTSATAIVISSLTALGGEYTNTQQVDDAGVTYTVWYKYVGETSDGIVGLMFYGDATVYKPSLTVYIDTDVNTLGSSGANLMSQIPIISGRTYFFKVVPNVGNPAPANLHVSVKQAQNLAVPTGSIYIRAASILSTFQSNGYTGLGGGFIDPNTGAILGFVSQFIPGEFGDYMPSTGEIIFGDEFFDPTNLKIYNANLNLLRSVAYTGSSTPVIRTSRELRQWLVVDPGQSPTVTTTYRLVTIGGSVVSTVAVGGANFGCTAGAVSADTLSVYLAGVNGSVGSPIKKWDIAGGAFVADFAAGIANYVIQDILVMRTGEVVVLYHRSSIDDIFVRTYDSAGTLLRTFAAPAFNYTTVAPRLGYANDDSLSWWLFLHRSTDGMSRFFNVRLSDNVTLKDIMAPSSDYFKIDEGATPAFRFVTSDSCPFVLVLTGVTGLYVIVPNKKHDTYYDADRKIPNPTIRTAIVGE